MNMLFNELVVHMTARDPTRPDPETETEIAFKRHTLRHSKCVLGTHFANICRLVGCRSYNCILVFCSNTPRWWSAAPTPPTAPFARSSSSAGRLSWSTWRTPIRTRMLPVLPVSVKCQCGNNDRLQRPPLHENFQIFLRLFRLIFWRDAERFVLCVLCLVFVL